jgi:diguanylate cyclase (GGDEF)-like protein
MNEKSIPTSPAPFNGLISGIDHGIEAHLGWNQKLMRCSLLHESPGDDMLSPNAHELCRFGLWFTQARPELDRFDAPLVQRIADAHQSMHAAVAAMCRKVLKAKAALPEELSVYESKQTQMVTLLNTLRQSIADAVTQNDVLTGLPLRHGMEHAFELRSKDAIRKQQSLWLAMIDVDKFKSVNDLHGHVVGDIALRHIAATLSTSLRANDVLIRFGGEEFLGLFLISESESVTSVVQRLLDALHADPLHTDAGLVLKLTVTVGVARVRPGECLTSAVERADHALLQGKAFGRDQYVLAAD